MIKIAKKRKPKAGTGGSLARGGGSLKKGLKKSGQLRNARIPSKKRSPVKTKTPKQKEKYEIDLKREKALAEKGWKVVRTKRYLDKPKKAIGKKGYPYAVLNKKKNYETFFTYEEKPSKKKRPIKTKTPKQKKKYKKKVDKRIRKGKDIGWGW